MVRPVEPSWKCMSEQHLLAEVLHEAVGAEIERLGMRRYHHRRAAGSVKSIIAAVPAKKFDWNT